MVNFAPIFNKSPLTYAKVCCGAIFLLCIKFPQSSPLYGRYFLKPYWPPYNKMGIVFDTHLFCGTPPLLGAGYCFRYPCLRVWHSSPSWVLGIVFDTRVCVCGTPPPLGCWVSFSIPGCFAFSCLYISSLREPLGSWQSPTFLVFRTPTFVTAQTRIIDN